jgi:hypothetical protein
MSNLRATREKHRKKRNLRKEKAMADVGGDDQFVLRL